MGQTRSSVLFCSALTAQHAGTWDPPFDHRNQTGDPNEVEMPAVPRQDWITLDTIDGRDLTTPLPTLPNRLDEKFNALHCCLIPYGPHRGDLLVLDGNLRNYSIPGPGQPLQRIRDKQPWAIVNPYWPAPHPYRGTQGHRFYNRTLTLPRDPQTNENLGELFCAGHRWMPDGRLFLAGGTLRYPTSTLGQDFLGSKLTWFFDGLTVSWVRGPDLAVARWYPSVCHDGEDLPGGRALVLGGLGTLDHFESYQVPFNANPPTALTDSRTSPGFYTDPRLYAGIPGLHANAPLSRHYTDYPRVHLLTDGRLFVSGFEAGGALLQHLVSSDPVYTMNHGLMPANSAVFNVHYPTCLYRPNTGGTFNTIVRIGGAREEWIGSGQPTRFSDSNLVEICVATTPGSTWSTGGLPNMYWDRHHFNVLYLPGGEMLAIGGLSWNAGLNAAVPNFQPELLFNNQFWTVVASQSDLRHYHSCAVLLPDARVFVSGGEGLQGFQGGVRPTDYQIYNPPYISLGLPRPSGTMVTTVTGVTIGQNALGGLTYGGTYLVSWDANSLPDGVGVERCVLISPSALTHHDDGGQRYYSLPIQVVDDTTTPGSVRQFTMPTNHRQLPRGWYMLFLVTNQGAPSELAYWVNVR